MIACARLVVKRRATGRSSGSRKLRGTQVAAPFYPLCETVHLAGVDPRVTRYYRGRLGVRDRIRNWLTTAA